MLKKRTKNNECLLINNQIREFDRKVHVSENYLTTKEYNDLVYRIQLLKKQIIQKPIKNKYELSLREKDLTIILTQAKSRLNI